ncbi:hypothetical protein, partial [Thiolapillus sp.]|uniref:hypothetical protein n=1 Tax=Thiolapillus sp. TaxID=2017437 RepID=UPI003AF76C13
MTRTAGAPIGCQRPSRFWGLGCPKIYHEAEDTLVRQSDTRPLAMPSATASTMARTIAATMTPTIPPNNPPRPR